MEREWRHSNPLIKILIEVIDISLSAGRSWVVGGGGGVLVGGGAGNWHVIPK